MIIFEEAQVSEHSDHRGDTEARSRAVPVRPAIRPAILIERRCNHKPWSSESRACDCAFALSKTREARHRHDAPILQSFSASPRLRGLPFPPYSPLTHKDSACAF